MDVEFRKRAVEANLHRTFDRILRFYLMVHERYTTDLEDLNSSYSSEYDQYLLTDDQRRLSEISTEIDFLEISVLDRYRKATLISIYSALEHAINFICLQAQIIKCCGSSFRDLPGTGIERAKAYLKTYANIDFGAFNKSWSFIMNFTEIRNCLVHADGCIIDVKNEVKIKAIVLKNHSISLRADADVLFENEYIEDAINHSKTLVSEILNSIHA